MNAKTRDKKQKIFGIILILPFICGAIFIFIGLGTLNDIFLEKESSINFISTTALALALFHIISMVILIRLDKIAINLPKPILKKTLAILLFLFMIYSSNFLLELSLRINFNYWLKSNSAERIELVVIDKNVHDGKGTDYYIIFNSKNGRLINKVKRKNYESFSIGEKYTALVMEGFFEGYFLKAPMNRVNN